MADVNDINSPYYLHHSDNPGLVLVSQPLTEDNFASWSEVMTIALSVKNKLGFVDGSIPQPDGSDSKTTQAWTRNNNIVKAWIFNSVSKEISASILRGKTACDIWKDLQNRFQKSSGPRIFQLHWDLASLRQEHQSVNVYYTKLKALWEELADFRPTCTCHACTCGGSAKLHAFFEVQYTIAFLMGLHDSFANVKGQILLMDPLPSISKVFSLILQDEQQKNLTVSEPPPTLAFAHKTNIPSKGRGRGRPFCTHCQIHGHTMDKCYKLHGYPPGFQFKPRPTESKVNQVSAPPPLNLWETLYKASTSSSVDG